MVPSDPFLGSNLKHYLRYLTMLQKAVIYRCGYRQGKPFQTKKFTRRQQSLSKVSIRKLYIHKVSLIVTVPGVLTSIKLPGPQWKKILITTNRNLTTRTVAIQGRSMAELQFNAVNRLGLHTEGLLTLCHFDIPNFRKMLTKC